MKETTETLSTTEMLALMVRPLIATLSLVAIFAIEVAVFQSHILWLEIVINVWLGIGLVIWIYCSWGISSIEEAALNIWLILAGPVTPIAFGLEIAQSFPDQIING